MEKLISTGELHLLLDAPAAEVNIQYPKALAKIYKYLGCSALLTHAVTDDLVELHGDRLYPRDFPAVTAGITLKDINGDAITGYTFGRYPGNIRTVNILDTNGDPTRTGYKKALISYSAGYSARETLTVLTYADLNTKTIIVTVDGVETTWTFTSDTVGDRQIASITSVNATATAIAAALGGTASGAVVTLPVGTSVELGTCSAAMLTITPTTLPEAFKACLAALIGAGIAEKQRAKGIRSYSIGEKSVSYDTNPAKAYDDLLSEHLGSYRLPIIRSS